MIREMSSGHSSQDIFCVDISWRCRNPAFSAASQREDQRELANGAAPQVNFLITCNGLELFCADLLIFLGSFSDKAERQKAMPRAHRPTLRAHVFPRPSSCAITVENPEATLPLDGSGRSSIRNHVNLRCRRPELVRLQCERLTARRIADFESRANFSAAICRR